MKRQNRIRKKGETQSASTSSSGSNAAFQISALLSNSWKYVLAAVVVMVAIFFYYQNFSSTAIVNLSNADIETLKEAFFGEQPHLFFCDRVGSRGSSSGNKNIPELFKEGNRMKGSTVNFAVINCSQLLPSNKTIYERFKLKKEVRPTIFGTAPWMKAPQQVTGTYLKETKNFVKFIDTVMAPKAIDVASDKDLMKYCKFNITATAATAGSGEDDITNTCLVLLRGKMHSKLHQELERRLVVNYPMKSVVAINGNKNRLSFEEEDKIMEMLPSENFALKLFALRDGTHYMPMVNPITWDYMNTFVTKAINSPLDEYIPTPGNKAITLVKGGSGSASTGSGSNKTKKTKKGEKKSNNQKQPKEEEDPQKKQADDDAARTEAMQEAVRAAARAAQAKREQKRREEMEQQEREYLGTDEADEVIDTEDAATGEEEDEEEDVIEL